MRKIIIASSLLAGLLLSAPHGWTEPPPGRRPPPVFEAEYSLHNSGLKVAKAQRRIVRLADSRFEYSSETRTVGLASLLRKDHIVEKSVWRFHDNAPKPDLYSYRRSGGKKNRAASVAFDWQQLQITNTLSGAVWEMPTEPELMDKLLYQVALMLDLEAGRSSVAYSIADGKKIKLYQFEKSGAERIRTPLGEFDTVKMIRYKDNGRRSVILWCAEALRFLPVKVESVEKDMSKTVAVIRSLRGIGDGD